MDLYDKSLIIKIRISHLGLFLKHVSLVRPAKMEIMDTKNEGHTSI